MSDHLYWLQSMRLGAAFPKSLSGRFPGALGLLYGFEFGGFSLETKGRVPCVPQSITPPSGKEGELEVLE